MTLGMAASSSARKEIGVLSHSGENSLMKMKGSAPNSSKTGSQVVPVTKAAPNFRIAGSDSRTRSPNSRRGRPRTHSAKRAGVFSHKKAFMFPRSFIFPVDAVFLPTLLLQKKKGRHAPPFPFPVAPLRKNDLVETLALVLGPLQRVLHFF